MGFTPLRLRLRYRNVNPILMGIYLAGLDRLNRANRTCQSRKFTLTGLVRSNQQSLIIQHVLTRWQDLRP
jgi:hypothetical protein